MLNITTTNNFSILLIGVSVFYFVYAFVYWLKSHKGLNRVYLFDIIFTQIILSLIFFYIKKLNINDGFISDIFDGGYSLCGILLGLFSSIFLISKKQNFSFLKFIERTFISYCFALLPFLVVLLFTGLFLGVDAPGDLAIVVDGVNRMPVIILWMICTILILVLYYSLDKFISKEVLLGLLVIIYAMCTFALEFFIVGYNPSIGKLVNIDQLFSVIIFIFGISIILMKFKGIQKKRMRRSVQI